jgi:hypothetical protein
VTSEAVEGVLRTFILVAEMHHLEWGFCREVIMGADLTDVVFSCS